ncbi:MAG: hypothetical protein PSV40_15655 [Polaromonas sp.]|uniref:hypothetical protein n=1 Tax=Polaromonas sp. TaxID=1869339 RepID=UPI002487E107|nr:hypothetical protein [Polaromonas sp.]MDI1270523.1 hypothetical protein [Polaromonas sp.]
MFNNSNQGSKVRGYIRIVAAWALYLPSVFSGISYAQVPQVVLAGVAYSGDAQTIAARFPYSLRYEQTLKSAGESPYSKVRQALTLVPPTNLEVLTSQIDELKGRDQALVASLVVNSETVSVEQFGQLRKLLVMIRGQTLFFDFKSMTVVRSYPISFAYIDTLDRQPTEEEVLARVKQVYEGTASKPGLYARFAGTLAKATLPTNVPRYLQVSRVSLSPDVLNALPDYLKSSPTVAETWAADLVSEALSTRLGIPLVPYSKGYAIGNVMSMRVSDSTVFTLTLPKPDYEISVDFTGLKKIKYGEVNAGASFIYGAYATLKIEEPLSGTAYMNTSLKNGEVKVVPMTQTYVDDFPAFYDSLNGLFGKLAEAIGGKGNTWVKAAAAAPDIESQIIKTRELINLCQ